jgi:hypothetical protein
MQLAEALGKTSPANFSLQAQTNHLLSGVLEQDGDEHFVRLYQFPHDRSSYLVIPKDSIGADVYQWTEAEAAAAGHVGFTVHRIEVPTGTSVYAVTVSVEKIGEMIGVPAGSSTEGRCATAAGAVKPAGCYHATGCPNRARCCTIKQTGGPCYCDSCCIG